MKIGIRCHDLNNAPFNNINDLIEELNKENIKYIQLVLKKVFVDYKMIDMNELKEAFKANNIKVVMMGAYFNPVHSNISKKEESIKWFIDNFGYADLFNASYVGSETGSYNDDQWTYNSKNHTEEAYLQTKKVFNSLVNESYKYKSRVCLEAAYNHIIYEPLLLNRLTDEIKVDNVVLDLYNYLNIDNHINHVDIFNNAIKVLNKKIVIFHIKDYIIANNTLKQVGIGKGLMRYDIIMKEIMKVFPNSYLILEGVKGEDIKTSVDFLRSFYE